MSTLYDKICKYLNNSGYTGEPIMTTPNPMGIPNGELGLLDETIVYWNIKGISQPTIEQLQDVQIQIEKENANTKIKQQIAELESKQARALRELALDIEGSRERLQSIDKQIQELRTQLQ